MKIAIPAVLGELESNNVVEIGADCVPVTFQLTRTHSHLSLTRNGTASTLMRLRSRSVGQRGALQHLLTIRELPL
jgi:hypothetical protein